MRKHFLKNGLVIGLSLLTLGTASIPSQAYAAELIVTTYDVTDENNAQLVNKRTVPIDMD
ncbi:hypothetical protein [Paenibacillus apiarius]|uniref:Uncharacterized protein n=1 Tax=Paenibacillus apiarius TaxID=46240 RepID=A0ABT4DV40_9BACL|nr:hypothetical protein [Paenibacillus apiarius]MCY9513486.1 hypothetical protein [Paenibacillus apiarius]MCY9521213.1 hypothetical protein [Paenibacillus apiarius]MCY9553402.1 hypothetical protein [Paenibacillus apiarius]MCY9559564.1 hypothetical protein [Paenibacillus apiarius]MCY9685431.1 hypothetical protein [Paenibacillus apiarius]